MQGDDSENELDETIEIVRRRQRYVRNTPKASTLVAKFMNRYSVASSSNAAQLENAWRQLVDSTTAANTQPCQVRRGVLEVLVANSAIHQRLIFKKKQLVEKLNQSNPLAEIKDIRFRVGEIESSG